MVSVVIRNSSEPREKLIEHLPGLVVSASMVVLVSEALEKVKDVFTALCADTAAEIVGTAGEAVFVGSGAALIGTVTASLAWAMSAAAVRRAAAYRGRSELCRMSGSDALSGYASFMLNGRWLVKNAGFAEPRIMNSAEYAQWRIRMDSTDIPVFVFQTGDISSVKPDCKNPDIGENRLILTKFIRGKAQAFNPLAEEPFSRIYRITLKQAALHAGKDISGVLLKFSGALYRVFSGAKLNAARSERAEPDYIHQETGSAHSASCNPIMP